MIGNARLQDDELGFRPDPARTQKLLRDVVEKANELINVTAKCDLIGHPQNSTELVEFISCWIALYSECIPDLARTVHNLQDYEAGRLKR